MQNVEVHAFIADRRSAATEQRDPAIDDKHLLMLLDQCKTIIDKVRKQAAQTGASVSLTELLVRIEQTISRLRVLLRLLEARPTPARNCARVQVLKTLMRATNRRHSPRKLCAPTAHMLP